MPTPRIGPLLLALSVALAACAVDADEADEAAPAADEAPAADAAAPALPGDAGAPRPDEYLVRMVGLGGAETAGTAALEPRGDSTGVTVALRGVPADGMYQGHVHEGDTCDAIGRVKWPLHPVTATGAAGGQSETTLAAPLDSVMDGNTLVVFHGEGGQPLVCGDIPVLPPNLPA